MLIPLILSNLGLLGAVLFILYQRKVVLSLRGAIDAEKAKRLTASDDEETLALLEASATVSPLARKLLASANDAATEIKLLATKDDEAWKNSLSAKTSPVQHWIICRDELMKESSDASRLACLRRYVEAGNRFTIWERSEIASMFQDETLRDSARELVLPKPTSVPAFRWSKQKGVAIVTLTCPCGEPADTWVAAVGENFKVACVTCGPKKMKEIDVVCSVGAIYVCAKGTPWRIGTKWIKASID